MASEGGCSPAGFSGRKPAGATPLPEATQLSRGKLRWPRRGIALPLVFSGQKTSGGNPSARGYSVAPFLRTLIKVSPLLPVDRKGPRPGGYLPHQLLGATMRI